MTSTTYRTLRDRASPWLAPWVLLGLLAGATLAVAGRATAQDEAPAVALASPDELAEIVGPIALYPDDLVGLVLPASTYPLQVVQAARLLEDRKANPNLQPSNEWDDSVVALLNYPEVVALLNDDLDWTYDLGAAVLNQRADVLDAIQDFRDRAYTAGNLRSDDRQLVSRDDGAIAIKPADPQVIYVPYYEPERVVVYQTAPVYHYYPWRYPVYYYPYPAGYVFDTGFFWGVRSWFSIGWHTHHVHVYDYGYRAHPYFGWRYYDPWFVRRNVYVNVNVNRGYAWEPRHRYGGRPVVRGYEGRVYTSREAPRVNRAAPGSTYRSRSTEGTVRGNTAARSTARSDPRVDGTGSAYRSRSAEGTARGETPARTAPRSDPRVERSAPSSTYRNRGSDGAARSEAPTRVAPRSDPRVTPGSAGVGSRQRADALPSAPRDPVYRSGRSAPSAAPTTPRESGRSSYQPSAPRDLAYRSNRSAPSTSAAMPRESARGAYESRAPRSAPSSRAPSSREPAAAPRGGNVYRGADTGSYRGGNSGGGNRSGGGSEYRGGGGQQSQAARGGERRSAAR